MRTLRFQPDLRPELPLVDGPKEYREQRVLFIRLDELFSRSGLEREFFALSVAHRKIDLKAHSAAEVGWMLQKSTLAFRSNIARMITGLDHRDFCTRLADSSLLQWFLQIGQVEGVSTFAKSTSDRYAHYIDADSLQKLNAHLISLLQGAQGDFGLDLPISFKGIFFDSTCLKAPIHHPVDWVLLRDATRSLMKAVERIRKEGLLARMPKAPLAFLSEMNSLCMAMTAKNRTTDGKKQRKRVLREMKKLLRRVEQHAQRHLNLLKELGENTRLHPGQIQYLINQMENIIGQVPAIIKQAHERIIGARKLANKDKILSLYDPEVQVIQRGKSNGEVEFGNNLWLGENADGFIVDYLLEKEKTSDAKQVGPAIERLIQEQSLPIQSVWGDRGLHSAENQKTLESGGIYSGLVPRDVNELSQRLELEPQLREGLKRRAGTEARISIVIRKFMGAPARAKGFENRSMMVGWAVLSHNLWKLARLEQAKQPAQSEPMAA